MKLLVATTNKGKFEEIYDFFKTEPFEIISLNDLDYKIEEPDEPYDDLVHNAIYKAKYYGDKTGLLTISDDTGLFVDSLNGWPGIYASRVGITDKSQWQTLLEKMELEDRNRAAEFRGALVFYNPENKELFIAEAKHKGEITREPTKTTSNDLSYDCIFFVREKGKTHAEMTKAEKASISWRGLAMQRVKYYLDKQYGEKHIVVPIAIIINENNEILLSLRNDPHRKEFHKKWEFPGGKVEIGEKISQNLVREVQEEIGYKVKIIRLFQYIHTDKFSPYEGFSYQVYLPAYLCKIISGDGQSDDQEVIEKKWFKIDELPENNLIYTNNLILNNILPELKKMI